jgi:hypothetical protein
MKKILLALMLFSACLSGAQTAYPRAGIGSNNDNTGRTRTYSTVTITPTSTMVTVPIQTTDEKVITIASTSISPTFTANVTSSYIGDRMTIFINLNATGTRTITPSTNIISAAATYTLAASKSAVLRYEFNGVKWIETGHTLEP